MKKRRIILILLLCWLGYSIISSNLVLYSPYYLREQGVLTEQVLLERFVKDTSYIERFPPENMKTKKHGMPIPLYNVLYYNAYLAYNQNNTYVMGFNNYFYRLDSTGKIVTLEVRDEKKEYIRKEITDEIKQQFKRDFYLFMEPITDNPTKPLLDLQWLYNLIYPRKESSQVH